MEQLMLYWFDKTTIKLNHIVIRYAFRNTSGNTSGEI